MQGNYFMHKLSLQKILNKYYLNQKWFVLKNIEEEAGLGNSYNNLKKMIAIGWVEEDHSKNKQQGIYRVSQPITMWGVNCGSRFDFEKKIWTKLINQNYISKKHLKTTCICAFSLYMRSLMNCGYVRTLEKSMFKYSLVNNTGILPPKLLQNGNIYDRNTEKMVIEYDYLWEDDNYAE